MNAEEPVVEPGTGKHAASMTTGPQARPPVAAPVAAIVGVLLALVVIALGLVAIREMLLGANAIAGPDWVASTASWVDGLRPAVWLVPVGVVAVLIGLCWVVAALKPRRRTEVKVSGAGGVWMRPLDISRAAHATADSVAGTTTALAKTGRRRVTVTVTATHAEAQSLHSQVAEAVTERLAPLERTLSVKVKTTITTDGGA